MAMKFGNRGWTHVTDEDAFERALECVRGDYQEDVILGRENISGSTLAGKAKKWMGKYHESRQNLLKRLKKNRVPHGIETGWHGRKILRIGPKETGTRKRARSGPIPNREPI